MSSVKRKAEDDAVHVPGGLDRWQRAAFDDVIAGRSIFLTGSAGNGKSYLIRHISKTLNELGRVCAVTSTTGVTALHIGGETLARFMRLGVSEGDGPAIWKRILRDKEGHRSFVAEVKLVRALVIDEVSMMSSQIFEAVSYLLCMARNSPPGTFFGGIQMIFCGDFSQLPPVKGEYAFKSPLWNAVNLTYHELKGSHRQEDDVEFQALLRAVRVGEVSPTICAKLRGRVDAALDISADVKPAELTSRRDEAERINAEKIALLPRETEHVFDAEFRWLSYGILPPGGQACESKEDLIKKNSITPPRLVLRTGTQVMLTANLNVEEGLANGSMGVVVDFIKNHRYTLKKQADEIKEDGETGDAIVVGDSVADESDEPEIDFPIVLFTNGMRRVMSRNSWITEDAKDGSCLSYTQVPLLPAFAITVHKSQGSTIDAVKMAMDNRMFSYGSAYVALSRVRSLKRMTLTSFQPIAIKTSSEVLDFYKKHSLSGMQPDSPYRFTC